METPEERHEKLNYFRFRRNGWFHYNRDNRVVVVHWTSKQQQEALIAQTSELFDLARNLSDRPDRQLHHNSPAANALDTLREYKGRMERALKDGDALSFSNAASYLFWMCAIYGWPLVGRDIVHASTISDVEKHQADPKWFPDAWQKPTLAEIRNFNDTKPDHVKPIYEGEPDSVAIGNQTEIGESESPEPVEEDEDDEESSDRVNT